ncbi:alpha/beta fold hydrolase [Chitinophaga pendula]|uniref:alpha/beta fold hydrolase n=1 Tax=Chitinophaga TaxID=79328 RepID=UPI000BB033A1|nr:MULTISPECIES: alpha/beta fold hydrolase [Chitinophaga]ASZ13486.1 alpha/beta hydrolase [Chitinophaga sp. MD30]UCJ08884.1 alpha/beta fold hydrolase [Chitinophaga pendula]
MKIKTMKVWLCLLFFVAATNVAVAQSKPKTPTFVLVHGAWHGGWCWQPVTTRLQATGSIVYTPTLSGLGEYKHQLSSSIDLNTHINDIVHFIEMQDLSEVILVGHSYAGAVIAGVADRIPGRLKKLVFLDALLIENGKSLSDYLPKEMREERKRQAAMTKGLSIPPLPASIFGVKDLATRKWVDERLTPQPYRSFTQPLILKHPFGNKLPLIYVACLDEQLSVLKQFDEKTRNNKDWEFYSLDTGHDAMITAPDQLATLLLRINTP